MKRKRAAEIRFGAPQPAVHTAGSAERAVLVGVEFTGERRKLTRAVQLARQAAQGGKEVHAADVARAADLLLSADAKAVAGQSYNCYDRYVAEQDVAKLEPVLVGEQRACGPDQVPLHERVQVLVDVGTQLRRREL